MRNRKEVEALKQNWKHDPVWDIEDTEGFEEYTNELKQYRLDCEKEWKERNEKHRQMLASKACPMSFNVWVEGHSWLNCMLENCAWWDDDNECCILKTLAHKELQKS